MNQYSFRLISFHVLACLGWQPKQNRDLKREGFAVSAFWTRCHPVSPLRARCCPPLLSAVSAHPVALHSAHPRRLSALTGAKQHCFRTCRELVKGRWVWIRGKGQRPKTSPSTSSCKPTRCDIPVALPQR